MFNISFKSVFPKNFQVELFQEFLKRFCTFIGWYIETI